jgi:cellulose synthase/poly-beta-1,6-N-acetylglucosamine synthase-like glycosyltransferase
MLTYQELILTSQKWAPVVREILNTIHTFSLSTYQILALPVIFFSVLFYLLAITGIFLKPKRGRIFKASKWPFVTIQIPTFNEPVALRCARKCLELDYPKEKLEIIIGDDSNDKKVSRLIDTFARKHKQVKVTRRGSNIGFKAGNLNHMLKYSNGEIIVIFDSDFVPPKNFLKKVIPIFLKDKKVGCVQAKWDYINIQENLISKLASTTLAVYHHILAVINHNHKVPLLFGSAQAIRKDLLVKLGGWQEGSLTEDVEFSLRVLENGYKIVYLPDVKVPGEVPFTLKGFLKQQRRWAYGNAKAFLQHAKWILFNGKLSFIQRSTLTLTLLGYVSAPLLVLFTFFGIVSFMTGEPAPINLAKFFNTTITTFIATAGFLAAGLVGLWKEGKLNMFFSVMISSITVGIIVSVGVTQGLINALLGKKMNWSMIRKKGNENLKFSE